MNRNPAAITIAVAALVIALVAGGCGGSGSENAESSVAPTVTAATSTNAPSSQPTTTLTSTSEAPIPTTTIFDTGDDNGDGFLVPGESGYWAAIGADAIRIEGDQKIVNAEYRMTIEADIDGLLYQKIDGTESTEAWFDGRYWHIDDAEGQRLGLRTAATFQQPAPNGVFAGTYPVDLLRDLKPVGQATVNGMVADEYQISGEDVLATFDLPEDVPIQIETATMRLLVLPDTNALVGYQSDVFAPSPLPGLIADIELRSEFLVSPIDALLPRPDLGLDVAPGDDTTRAYLVNAIRSHAIDPTGPADVALPLADVQTAFADSYNPDNVDLGPVSEADTDTIGYENRVFVLQSASGTWFCQRRHDSTEEPLSASAATRDEALAACSGS